MAIYPIHRNKQDWKTLRASHSFYSQSYADESLDLYLRDEHTEDNCGKTHHYFRLCAKQPHSTEMALAYDVYCPNCGQHMKPVARMRDANELFLYECPSCSK